MRGSHVARSAFEAGTTPRGSLGSRLRAFVAVAPQLFDQRCHLAREKAATSRACERSWLASSSMLFDCACFAAGRLRSDPEATIRAIAWVTMTGRVRRGDPCNMAVHGAFNCGQTLLRAGFALCVHPDRSPETIWLHSFSASQICDNASMRKPLGPLAQTAVLLSVIIQTLAALRRVGIGTQLVVRHWAAFNAGRPHLFQQTSVPTASSLPVVTSQPQPRRRKS